MTCILEVILRFLSNEVLVKLGLGKYVKVTYFDIQTNFIDNLFSLSSK